MKNKKTNVSKSDITMEYVKGLIWLIMSYLYFHFIIMGY